MLSTYLGRESEARGGGGASVPLIPGGGCSPHQSPNPFSACQSTNEKQVVKKP